VTAPRLRSAACLAGTTGTLGITLLVWPNCAATFVTAPLRRRVSWVARVLGARVLVQTVVMVARPDRRVFAASAVVDGMHAASMVALAAEADRYRRVALVSAAAATLSALATCAVCRELPA
jgi:hypothetical protein